MGYAPDTPKRIRRLLREQAALAYQEELRRALLPLAEAFRKWEQGQVTSGELSQLIHEYHQGPARDIFVRYDCLRFEMAVPQAIAEGLLDRTKVPQQFLDYFSSQIKFLEEEEQRRRPKAHRPSSKPE
jgi:hypothetical protein